MRCQTPQEVSPWKPMSCVEQEIRSVWSSSFISHLSSLSTSSAQRPTAISPLSHIPFTSFSAAFSTASAEKRSWIAQPLAVPDCHPLLGHLLSFSPHHTVILHHLAPYNLLHFFAFIPTNAVCEPSSGRNQQVRGNRDKIGHYLLPTCGPPMLTPWDNSSRKGTYPLRDTQIQREHPRQNCPCVTTCISYNNGNIFSTEPLKSQKLSGLFPPNHPTPAILVLMTASKHPSAHGLIAGS